MTVLTISGEAQQNHHDNLHFTISDVAELD